MSGRGTPALEALRAAGVAHAVQEYEAPAPGSPRDRDRRPQYGLDAAAALGLDPARVFKTLVAAVDGTLVAAIVPVAGELDLKALAAVMGARRASLAEPAQAERATGYVVGGISPLGMRRRLPSVLDASAEALETIYVSGGRRGLQLEISPADLARLIGARTARIARLA
jgi:Cys-tRNA(Pro)/Cys-tRNA(Cys) deacylase